MPYQRMIPTDETEGYAKTSLTMTRAMSEDIGLKVKKVLEDIANNTVALSYTEWQWMVSQAWCDEIWIMAMVKAIQMAKREGINLNKNVEFLNTISEMTASELKNEFRKTHPIAKLSLMDLIQKKPPEPEKPRKYEDLWLNPKELKEKYKRES